MLMSSDAVPKKKLSFGKLIFYYWITIDFRRKDLIHDEDIYYIHYFKDGD